MASKPPSPLAPRPSSLSLEPLEPRVLLDASAFDASPALFAANLGQWQDPSVRYVFQGAASAVAHTDAGVLFQISQRAEAGIQRSAFSVAFVGAEAVAPVGLDPSEALYNYYLGDPATWRSGVPTFQTVAYQGLWAGIDLLTWGRRDGLKYEFHLAPGADPAQVRLRYSGVEGLRLDDGGALHIATPLGEVVDSAPFIYQDVGGHRTQVAGAFALLDADTVSFAVTGPYDPRAELVIDPTLAWSSYLGGDSDDVGMGIAVDASGNAFLTGTTATLEPEFPTTGGFDTTLGGTSDAFITKVSAAGSLLWSTYLGGSGAEAGYGIAVHHAAGSVFVTGKTTSSNFPTTGGFDTTLGGTQDAFVTKVSGAGALLWSSYLGGSASDAGSGIAVDGSGDAFIAGYTESSNFPTTGGFDTALGGTSDGFVAKVGGAGGLLWASYLGGSATDAANGIGVDGSGNALIAGSTTSGDFPTAGGFDTTLGGLKDAFVAKVSGAGGFAWASYLGGSGTDDGYAIAVVGSSGEAFVAGETASTDFPTSGGFQTAYGGGTGDAFVAKIGGGGTFSWASYLGGVGYDYADGVAVDGAGDAFVTGATASAGLSTPDAFQTSYGGGASDAFVTKVSGAGSRVWSSYLGGSADDVGWGIAADASGNPFVTGYTMSANFPTPGGFDTSQGGYADVFVTKVNVASANNPPTLTTVSTLAGGTEDQDYTITYVALAGAADEADADGDPLSFRVEAVSSGTLTKGGVPVTPGTTLLSAGESLVWHPAADANGTLQAFTVKAWDGQAASATAVPVNVAVAPANDAPTLTTVNALAGGTEDQDYTITYAALKSAADEADIDGDTLSFRIEAVSSGTLTKGGVPVTPGTTLLSAGESLVWHPAADANGTLQAFTVRAWDGQAASPTAVPVSVQVAAVNDAPTLTTVNTLAGGTEDQDYAITYAALAGAADEADADGDPLSFRIEAVSSGTLTKGGVPVTPGTTLLSAGESLVWRPAADANGTLQAFTVKAWDGQAASPTAVPVSVQVAAVNDAPTLTTVNALAGGTEDQDYTITYAALAGAADEADADGDPLSFRIEAVSSGTLTKGGVPVTPGTTLLSAGESLVWHPAADANGTLQAFTVKAWDGQAASATAVPVNVAVAPANDAPVAQDGGFGVEEDGSHSGSLAATDVDGDPLTFAIVSGPANGALTAFDPATGAYTYEPADDYRGPDSFTFKANDATVDSNEATITITVTPMNDAPVAQDGAFSVPEDGSHSGSAVAADTEADPLTYAVVTGPAHGSLTAFDTATGAFTYEPADDYHGPDSFTFKANDGMEDSNEATVTIAVTPVNDEPAFGGPFPSDPTVLLVGQPYAFALAAGDVDGDTLAYSLAAGPAWLSVDPATGVLSGTPNRRAHVGGSTVTVRVDDGQGGNDEHSFGLTVQGQVITLGSAIPVPLTKVAYTDASGDLASVGAKAKVGVFYLVRGVAPGPGGAYSLTTPGDLVAIEGEGTDAKAGLSIKLKAAVTGQVPATSVTDIAVNGSFNLSAPAMGLLGNMSVTGGVGRFAIGDVAAQHAITIGLDPLIKGTSLVFGRVRDATLASLSPLRLLSAIEWLDTDATPDQVVAPWIASLATRGSKTIGGPRGDFEAGLALSGAGALKGTLGKVSIAGSLNRAAWTITGSAGAIAVRGDLTNASIVADLLGSVAVTGRISQDGTDGDADVIRALSGGFSVRDLTGTWWIALAQDHLFSTLRAFVG